MLAGGNGADTLTGTGNLAALATITMDGGSGDDTVRGVSATSTDVIGQRAAGNDYVDGDRGTATTT